MDTLELSPEVQIVTPNVTPTYEAAMLQIRRQFLPTDVIAIMSMPQDGTGVQHRFIRVSDLTVEDLARFDRINTRDNKHIYVAQNPYKEVLSLPNQNLNQPPTTIPYDKAKKGRTKENIADIRALYLDIDEGGLARLNQVLADSRLPKPNLIVESSPDKYNLIWYVTMTQADASALLFAMTQDLQLGADPKCRDLTRVLRLAGYRNIKPKYDGKGEDGGFPVVSVFATHDCDRYTASDFQFDLDVRLVAADAAGITTATNAQTDNADALEAAFAEASITTRRQRFNLTDLKWVIPCPWEENHSMQGGDSGAVVIVFKNGAVTFSCQHSHCNTKKWGEYREYLETVIGHSISLVPSVVFVSPENDVTEVQEDLLPEFPMITGSIHDLAVALDPDLPYQFKVMAIVTRVGLAISGDAVLDNNRHLQTRIYCAMVGEPWCGKSASNKQVGDLLDGLGYNVLSSMDSGPALVQTFSLIAPDGTTAARMLLDPDEIKDSFEKAKDSKNGKSTLFGEFLKLYESNVTGNTVKSKEKGKTESTDVRNAHLAIIGGATPTSYEHMWQKTGGGSDGLQSRFVVVGMNPAILPLERRETDSASVGYAVARIFSQCKSITNIIKISRPAMDLFLKWWNNVQQDEFAQPHSVRLSDHVKRFLMILAVTNDTNIIDESLMQMGLAFGSHVLACRQKYNPQDSSSNIQSFEQRIVRCFERSGVPMTIKMCRESVHPDRYDGAYGAFNMAIGNLQKAGKLVIKGTNLNPHKVTWALDTIKHTDRADHADRADSADTTDATTDAKNTVSAK